MIERNHLHPKSFLRARLQVHLQAVLIHLPRRIFRQINNWDYAK